MAPEELARLQAFGELVMDGSFQITLNMNDTFAFASADAEDMPTYDIKHVVPLFQQYGHDALNAYAAVKRGYDVMDDPSLRTSGYYDAKAKLLVLKSNIPYFMEM